MLHRARLQETIESLRSGDRTPRTYVEQCCDCIDEIDADVRAFLPESNRRERLLEEARDLEDRHAEADEKPPLYGIPVGVKDIVRIDGFPTRFGSELPPEAFAGPEASAISMLREAGSLVLGKTVTTAFAHYPSGPTRNPHALDHTPGGSSSGSAAAVAAGMCPLALGTQTSGSVLRPAAFCGVVGFKPSYGRVPMDGVITAAVSNDHLGWFTQDVDGAAITASVLCTEWEASTDPDRRPALGVPSEAYLQQADSVALEAFEGQIASLKESGYEVRRTDLFASIEEIAERHRRLNCAERALAQHERYEEYTDLYPTIVEDDILEGREISVGELAELRSTQIDRRETVAETMEREDVDVWISPTAPGPAPEGLDWTGDPSMNVPWSRTGVPVVSVPAGKSPEGLPLGLRCGAGFGEDERLLAWAKEISRTLQTD